MPGSAHESEGRHLERQVNELQTQLKFLEEETSLLRRRLRDAPGQVKILEDKLAETRTQLAQGPQPKNGGVGRDPRKARRLFQARQGIEGTDQQQRRINRPK